MNHKITWTDDKGKTRTVYAEDAADATETALRLRQCEGIGSIIVVYEYLAENTESNKE